MKPAQPVTRTGEFITSAVTDLPEVEASVPCVLGIDDAAGIEQPSVLTHHGGGAGGAVVQFKPNA
jgi:hypothetical protein